MPISLSPLQYIGVVVPSAEKAFSYLQDTLGARKIHNDLSAFLSDAGTKVLHVGVGDTVLCYIEPQSDVGPWAEFMKRYGPGIHHLGYVVDDIDAAVAAITGDGGVDTLMALERDWAKLLGADFTNPRAKTEYVFDTLGLLGFHLALYERPGENEQVAPATRYPTGEDQLIGIASTMLHVELTTPDKEKAYAWLNGVFASQKVEKAFSGILDSAFMGIEHVNLSNVVLQFCQPIEKEWLWWDLLKENGAFIHNLNFLVRDIAALIARTRELDVPEFFEQWLAEDSPPFYMLNTKDLLGFHLEHGQPSSDMSNTDAKEVLELHTDFRLN